MWRRRRDDARSGWPASRTGPDSSGSRRRGLFGLRRARRMDRQGPAQVALKVPPDYARVPAAAASASVAHQTDGRLGDLMPSVFCTACGAENPEGARFCSHCGTALVRLPADRMGDTTSTISLGGSDLDSETGDELAADEAAAVA